jgi:hypothetical protein
MTEQANTAGVKALLTRWFTEIWVDKKLHLAPQMVTSDAQWNDIVRGGLKRQGLEPFYADFKAFHQAIKDFRVYDIDVMGEGLRGAFRVIGEGTLVGPQLGPPPTNEPIVARCIGMTWHRPNDFKIIRCQQYVGWEGVSTDDLRDVMGE